MWITAFGKTTLTKRFQIMADIIASQGSTEKIRFGSRITLHFALLMPSGEEIDTTRRGQPAALTLGDGNLLPGFEEALIGLATGDDAQLVIPAEQAFGERVEANVRLLARSMFNDFTSEEPLEPGLVVSFQAPDGELPGVVKAVFEDTVQVDFNHPLSGSDITFDVSILSVEEPLAEEAE
jgi:FKBP-type peptidyl-prolyl cis-trans isomerase SlpA